MLEENKVIGYSDEPNYATPIDMIVNLWNLQDSASSEAHAGEL